jgi:hypothetical protein
MGRKSRNPKAVETAERRVLYWARRIPTEKCPYLEGLDPAIRKLLAAGDDLSVARARARYDGYPLAALDRFARPAIVPKDCKQFEFVVRQLLPYLGFAADASNDLIDAKMASLRQWIEREKANAPLAATP